MKTRTSLPVALLATACLLFITPGVAWSAAEKILRFHSDITVHPDASMTVRETIRVQSAGVQIKRGIYRDFPTKYKDRWGNSYVSASKLWKYFAMEDRKPTLSRT